MVPASVKSKVPAWKVKVASAPLAGGLAPAALNAANEIAVDAFLSGQINFVQIAQLVDGVMQSWRNSEPGALEEVYAADLSARDAALRQLSKLRQ